MAPLLYSLCHLAMTLTLALHTLQHGYSLYASISPSIVDNGSILFV